MQDYNKQLEPPDEIIGDILDKLEKPTPDLNFVSMRFHRVMESTKLWTKFGFLNQKDYFKLSKKPNLLLAHQIFNSDSCSSIRILFVNCLKSNCGPFGFLQELVTKCELIKENAYAGFRSIDNCELQLAFLANGSNDQCEQLRILKNGTVNLIFYQKSVKDISELEQSFMNQFQIVVLVEGFYNKKTSADKPELLTIIEKNKILIYFNEKDNCCYAVSNKQLSHPAPTSSQQIVAWNQPNYHPLWVIYAILSEAQKLADEALKLLSLPLDSFLENSSSQKLTFR